MSLISLNSQGNGHGEVRRVTSPLTSHWLMAYPNSLWSVGGLDNILENLHIVEPAILGAVGGLLSVLNQCLTVCLRRSSPVISPTPHAKLRSERTGWLVGSASKNGTPRMGRTTTAITPAKNSAGTNLAATIKRTPVNQHQPKAEASKTLRAALWASFVRGGR